MINLSNITFGKKELLSHYNSLPEFGIERVILRNWPFMVDHNFIVESFPAECVPEECESLLSFLHDYLGWRIVDEDEELDEYNLRLNRRDLALVIKSVETFAKIPELALNDMGLLDADYCWQKWERKPQKPEYFEDTRYQRLLELGHQPKLQKTFWRHWNNWRKQDDSSLQFNKLMFLICLFREKFDQYLAILEKNPDVQSQINAEQSYHDMFLSLDDWFPEEYQNEIVQHLINKASGSHWAQAQGMVNNWQTARALGWEPKMSYERFVWYTGDGMKVDTALLEAKRLRNEIVHCSIPKIAIQQDSWTVRTLNLESDSEIRLGLTVGEFTGCCQKIGGAAASSAMASVSSGDQQVLLAELDGDIYAQSWMWRSGDVLVLDNLEIKATTDQNRSKITQLWLSTAKELIGRFGIREVWLGVGNGDHDKELLRPYFPRVNTAVLPTSLMKPKGTYSDAIRAVRIA